jgi:Flp pilus assembly pilin Flp
LPRDLCALTIEDMKAVRQFIADEQGQDLVEYSLILAFVMFTIVALGNGFHNSINGVTTVTNAHLAAANSVLP